MSATINATPAAPLGGHSLNAIPAALLGVRSDHQGGANAVTCDGRAHFLADQMAPNLLKALLTATGGEPARAPPR